MNGHGGLASIIIYKVHDVGDCDVDVQDFGDGLWTGKIILRRRQLTRKKKKTI